MKKIVCFILITIIFLTSCSQYAEPDIAVLNDKLLENQNITEPTAATSEEIAAIFAIDADNYESCSVYYSGKGGFADMVAIFIMNSGELTDEAAQVLEDYRAQRYEDFKGYAPMEAEKLENGRVLVYGRYVLLLVLPDISAAIEAADAAFEA